MPSKRKAASPKDSTATICFEATLWLAADSRINNMDAAGPSGARQPAGEGGPTADRGGVHQSGVPFNGNSYSRSVNAFN